MTEPDYEHTTGNAANVVEHRARGEALCMQCRMYRLRLRGHK